MLGLEREIARLCEQRDAVRAEHGILLLRAAREIERLAPHEGVRCDGCGASPVRGQRWACVQCSGSLCGGCREDTVLAAAWGVRCRRGHCLSRMAQQGGSGAGSSPWVRASEALSALLLPRRACSGFVEGGEACGGAVAWGCGLCSELLCQKCFCGARHLALAHKEVELVASEGLLERALAETTLCAWQHTMTPVAAPGGK